MSPHFGVCFRRQFADELAAAGVSVHDLGAVRFSRPWTVLAARRALLRVLRHQKIDAIMTHGAWPHAVFGPVARRTRIPVICFVHDPPGASLIWLERLASRCRPDRVICNSRYTASQAGRIFDGVATRTVYCPVDAPPVPVDDGRRRTREKHGAAPNDVVIVQVGRWEPHKGHLLLLSALAKLRDVPNWVCWQAGRPQRGHEQRYFDEVQESARQLAIGDRFKFLGWVPNVHELYAAADVYCQPNASPEPFGITYIEAMYAGLPVIAVDEGGPAEIVTPACGTLIPRGDVEALRATLAEWIADAARRRDLGKAGFARANALSDPKQQIGRLYEAIAQQAQAGSTMDGVRV
ncbi:MAG: glycosyltransferase family 4 protein [Anaerolineae bacterium]|nr:glycosyltransferase family 4 protein [Phycisphaerae bacterium]